MKYNKSFLNEPSKKMLVFSSALALVACTIVLWGVIGHSGKLVRENAKLALSISLMAPEPRWNETLTRASLEKSLKASFPKMAEGQISFAAPQWAIVHTQERSYLLKWSSEKNGVTWTLLDEAEL